jgi:uncharacterized protein (TIGR02145 family)/uncharacterized repeat protein (TIGR02543 family)
MKKSIRTQKRAAALIALAAISTLALLSVNCNDSGVNSGGESKYLNMFLDVFSKNPGQNGNAYTFIVTVSPAEGGTVSRSPDKASYPFGEPVTVTATPANDYTFIGWSGATTGTTNPAVITMDGDKALTAVFGKRSATRFTIHFNSNGGGNAPEPITADSGSNITLHDQQSMEKIGYNFSGWNTKNDGTGTAYGNDVSYLVIGDVTLYAVWVVQTYKLATNISMPNSGTVSHSPDKSEYTFGEPVTVTATPANGYTFTGWSGAASGTINPITITMDGDKALTAGFGKQGAKQFTVYFNSNVGGSAPGAITADSGSSISLPDQRAMEKIGYSFGGWSTKNDGTGTSYAANAFYVVKSEITLFAVWTLNIYTIMFDANGGAVTTTSGTTGEGWKLASLPTPTRNGYTLSGWFTTSAATGGTEVTTSYVFNANTTIYARWTLINYTITFDANGGTVTPASGLTGEGWKLSLLPTPTKTGYTFGGWYTTSAATGGTQVTSGYVFSTATTIYARWAVVNYTIIYTLDGGSVTTANPTSYNIETASFTLNNPTKTGYTFTGWTGTNGMTAQTAVTVAKGNTGNREYTANWTAIYYTLTANVSQSGGGSVSRSPNETSYPYGTSVTVTATPVSGYIFSCWSGASTSINASVTITIDGNKTLTANFAKTPTPWDTIRFTDSRDNKSYKAVKIGNQRWMAENLNYQSASGNSSCHDNSADSCNKYGRLYDWATAMDISTSYNRSTWGGSDVKRQGVCPSGWHLPSRAEWHELAEAVGGQTQVADDRYYWLVAGNKLKSKIGWNWNKDKNISGNGTDDYGFSALPGGYRYYNTSIDVGYDGYWWTATESVYIGTTSCAYRMRMGYSHDVVNEHNSTDKASGNPVRCVKDN